MKEYKRLVGYVRKSRSEHGKTEEELLQEQRGFIKKKSKEFGQEITIYQEVVSGESIDNRAEFKKVLALLKAKQYDGLVVRDLTRLTRGSYKDFAKIVELIEKYDIDIITQQYTFSQDEPFSLSMLRFNLSMGKEEIEMIKFRLQNGKKNAAARGEWMVTAPQSIPFGYIYNPHNQKLKINKEKAKHIRMMFKMYGVDGTTMHQIKLKLEAMKVLSPKGKDKWNNSTIKKMLQNEVYLGTVIYNRSKWFLQDNGKGQMVNKKVPRKEAEIIRAYNGHDAIVTQEIFDKVQERLESKVSSSPVPAKFELSELAHLVRCPGKKNIGCGRHLSKKFYARKYTKLDGTVSSYPRQFLYCKECERSIRYYDILDMIIAELKKIKIDENRLKEYYSKIELFKNDHKVEMEMVSKSLEKALNRKRVQRELYLDSVNNDDGIYTKREYDIDSKQLQEQIIFLQLELEKLKNSEKVDFKDVKKNVKKNIDYVFDIYERANTSSLKNEVLRSVIDYVEIEVLVEPKAKQPALYDITLNLQQGLFL